MCKMIATFTLATIVASAFVDGYAERVVSETCKDGAVTVTERSADGVNLVQYEVDGSGAVSNLRTTLAHVPDVVALKNVNRWRESIPKSGDVVQIDDTHRFVLLSPSDYAELRAEMRRIRTIYDCMNSNETGRAALHGQRGHTTVTNGTITVEYADGYRHVENARANRIRRGHAPKAATSVAPKAKTAFDLRREAILKRRREAASRTNEVTVTVGGGK